MRARISFFMTSILILGLLTSFASQAAAATSDSLSGKIVFSSVRDGNTEIYSMHADGSAQTRLTSNSAVDDQPKWSPDGSKIVFVSNRAGSYEIYVMNADGSNPVQLTTNSGIRMDYYLPDGMPDWSPDGAKIAFCSYQDGSARLYTMDSDGSDITRLTSVDSYEPDWSPDGSQIIFLGRNPDTLLNVSAINPDGTNLHVIGEHPRGQGLAYSPDGQMIVQTQSQMHYPVYWNVITGEATSIAIRWVYYPTWSPDSRWLAYGNTSGIAASNLDGSTTFQLTDYAGDAHPSWAPENVPPPPASGNTEGIVASVPVPSGGYHEYCFFLQVTNTTVPGVEEGQLIWCSATTTDFPNLLTVGTHLTGILDNYPGWWEFRSAGGAAPPPIPSGENTSAVVASTPIPSGAPNEYCLFITIMNTTVPGLSAGQQVWCAATTVDFPNLLTAGASVSGNLDNSLGWWVLKKAGDTLPPPGTGETTGTVAGAPMPSGGYNEHNFYLQITSTTVPGISVGQQIWCAATTADFPDLLTLGVSLTGNLDNSAGWWVLRKTS